MGCGARSKRVLAPIESSLAIPVFSLWAAAGCALGRGLACPLLGGRRLRGGGLSGGLGLADGKAEGGQFVRDCRRRMGKEHTGGREKTTERISLPERIEVRTTRGLIRSIGGTEARRVPLDVAGGANGEAKDLFSCFVRAIHRQLGHWGCREVRRFPGLDAQKRTGRTVNGNRTIGAPLEGMAGDVRRGQRGQGGDGVGARLRRAPFFVALHPRTVHLRTVPTGQTHKTRGWTSVGRVWHGGATFLSLRPAGVCLFRLCCPLLG